MPHIRIFGHYIHTPFLIMGVIEGALIVAGVFLAYWWRFDTLSSARGLALFPAALAYAAIVLVAMLAMGVYESHVREGYSGMILRTAVAVFMIGSLGAAILLYLVPEVLRLGRGTLALAAIASFVLIIVFRIPVLQLLNQEALKRRILVLGTGRRAAKIAFRMRRRYDQRSCAIVGYLPIDSDAGVVTEAGGRVIQSNEPLPLFCRNHHIDEIVVAIDERRRRDKGGAGLPLDALMECRMLGIDVCDVQSFIERETGKLDVDLLQQSWVVFGDGFVHNRWRTASKRVFDLLVSSLLLLVSLPLIVVTILCIWVEGGFRGPILYRQMRVGLDGVPFEVAKFRSMRADAEADGKAVWAQRDDPRITRVGAVMRRMRIDELPQLLNVLKGEMSFVGPRPERPEFVEDLEPEIPYYAHRHRIKPGLTGWAQLCYPYGASLDDAKEKLQYDLYYLKNHSLLLDLIILMQTVDVVLAGPERMAASM